MGSLALGHASAHLLHRWLLPEGRCPPGSSRPCTHLSVADGSARPSDQQRQEVPAALGAERLNAAAGFLPGAAQQPGAGGGSVAQPDGKVDAGLGFGVSEPAESVDGRRPQLLRRLSLEEAEEQLRGAAELDEEVRQDRLTDGTSATVLGRSPQPRLSLEEVEEQLPGGEELDEETREDQLIERISQAAVMPW